MKSFLIFLSVLCFIANVSAQSLTPAVGIKCTSGLSYCLDPVIPTSMPNKYNFHLGLQCIQPIKDSSLSLETGAYFTEFYGMTSEFKTVQVNYVQLPILLRVQWKHFYTAFGPQITYYLSTTLAHYNIPSVKFKADDSSVYFIKRINIGLTASGGYNFKLNNSMNFFVEALVNFGSYSSSGYGDVVHYLNAGIGTGINFRI